MSKNRNKGSGKNKPAPNQNGKSNEPALEQSNNTPAPVEESEAEAEPVRTRGVVLIALGNPEYGKLAWNLLMTIRAADKETPVALVHNHTSLSHISATQQAMFSQLIPCPVEHYTHENKVAYVKPKVYLYDLSPYDDTLFMDSDVAVMPDKKISDLINELSTSDFTIKNTGRFDIASGRHEGNSQYGYGGWDTNALPKLAAMYGIKDGHFYQLQGEVFWFRKCSRVRALFDVAKRAFTEQKAFLADEAGNAIGFAGQNMNDELAFIIALAYIGLDPHVIHWLPTYWYLLEPTGKNPNRSVIMGSYWMLSVGGNNVPPVIESFYNDIVARACFANRVPSNFKLKRKSTFLTERVKF